MLGLPAILTAAQCRAARALIEWPAEKLAEVSAVDLRTIADFESRFRRPDTDTLRRLRTSLEDGGVQFIAENGGGAGVRLKFSRREVGAIRRWEAEGGATGEDDIL